MSEKVSPYIALGWYDGPLLEIATVDFPEPRPEGEHERLIQVCTFCSSHPDEETAAKFMTEMDRSSGATFGSGVWTRAVIRLSRDDLQAMLDLYDGKPVKDCTDR